MGGLTVFYVVLADYLVKKRLCSDN